ncbi:unnamed protein product, partial [Didymodactylos carnosus]
LNPIIHRNFLDYSSFDNVFLAHDTCLWCLGISQNKVNETEYYQITYDYVMEAAKQMLKSNPEITFLFVSGEGADSTEQSRFLFGRVKGKTENDLLKLAFKHIYILRPGFIKPMHKNSHTAWYEKLANPLYYPVKLVA